MAGAVTPSFFEALAPGELERMLASMTRRTFPAGAEVLTEGDRPAEMHVVITGVCGVFVTGPDGTETPIGQLGPGATIGEMALFAGQAEAVTTAPATVRALTDLETVALDAPGFYKLATEFPQLLHNIGAILSARLTRSYQHAVQAGHGRVTLLVDDGAPPLLAWALAGSVAWHSRAATVLVVVGGPGSPELEALAARRRDADGGARLILARPAGEYAPAALAGTVEELTHHHANVLLLVHDPDGAGPGPAARTLHLTGPEGAARGGPDDRPGHTVRGWTAPGRHWRPDRDGVVGVPSLTPDDERALAGGMLPHAPTGAGRAAGWVARDLCGLKVGLALGAGSIRGYAHYGVLRVLDRAGLAPDYITGCSVGAIIASMIALGLSTEEALREMETSTRAFKLTAPIHSLLSSAVVSSNFRKTAGDRRIEDLDLPLALVAADLTTGREVVFRRGLVRMATLASMAIPGVYPPVRMGEHVLVDGGVVNPVPISVASGMGADVVIAVSLGRPAMEPLPDLEAVEGKGRLPLLVQTISRSVDVMQRRIGASAVAAAGVLIEPVFPAVQGGGLQSFTEGRPYIAPGEEAAEKAMPAILDRLPWLRP